MEKNLDTTNPWYSEQILPVPWPFIISRIHCGLIQRVRSVKGLWDYSTENNIPFPSLANHFVAFQILESWPWPQGNPITTCSAWNTRKALRPLVNVRLPSGKSKIKVLVKENKVPTEENSSRPSIFATKASYKSN